MGRTVLLVEDHPVARNHLRQCLDEMGFVTFEAGDCASALKRLSELAPDLICVTLMLPESSGYEVCEFVRASPRHQGTRVLMMSPRAYPEDRAHAHEAGADGFLAKPFSVQEFRSSVEGLLAAGRPASAGTG